MKKDIIESLYKVMCSATTTAIDARITNNDYFKRRVLGFRAEIEFENLIKKSPKVDFLEGGQFISKKLTGELGDKNVFIYTTISSDKPRDYLEVYKTISKWEEVESLIYIKMSKDGWVDEPCEIKTNRGLRKQDKILRPAYVFYQFNTQTKDFDKINNGDFDIVLNHFPPSQRRPSLFRLRKKKQFNYFEEYNFAILQKIYANRYFLDVIMRKAPGRQIIDLDGFLVFKNKIILVEIKEKSPITSDEIDKWKYGWDSRRILWYLYLQKKISMQILYSIRQINNRTDRKFVQWDSIFLDDFLRGVGWSTSRAGGGGEDTLLAPYSFFRRLKDIIKDNTN